MCNTLREYVLLSSISWPLQDILSHQPELTKRVFHDHLAQGQLPEAGLLNPLLQFTAWIGFICNIPPRLRNRQRFGSTTGEPGEPGNDLFRWPGVRPGSTVSIAYYHYLIKKSKFFVTIIIVSIL